MSLTHVDPHVSEIVMVWIQSGDLLMVWIQISLLLSVQHGSFKKKRNSLPLPLPRNGAATHLAAVGSPPPTQPLSHR
jgi:hypothetical protein